MNFDIDKIIKLSEKPKLFEAGTKEFWDDPYISKKMLETHLNPKNDGASRNHSFMEKSVGWIHSEILKDTPSKILDLGCGPGLYAEKLAFKGHHVTGLDISVRSIQYAINSAKEKMLDIDYRYQDFLTMDFNDEFDMAMIIYCEIGAFSDNFADIILNKIYKALKPGGIILFDTFTVNRWLKHKDNKKDWNVNDGGYWSYKKYLSLRETFEYPENETYLSQYIILTEDDEIDIHRIWDHVYSEKTITELLKKHSFKPVKLYGNVIGEEFTESSETIAIIGKKI